MNPYCFRGLSHVTTSKKFNPQDISAFGWMLQSYHKKSTASSSLPGFEPEKAVDENFVPGGRLQVAKQVNIS